MACNLASRMEGRLRFPPTASPALRRPIFPSRASTWQKSLARSGARVYKQKNPGTRHVDGSDATRHPDFVRAVDPIKLDGLPELEIVLRLYPPST